MSNTSKAPCALCGMEAKYRERYSVGTEYYGCRRCGQYVIHWPLDTELWSDKSDRGFRMACVARERNLRGHCPIVCET